LKDKANLALIAVTLFSAMVTVCLVYIYVNTKISNTRQEIEQKYATLPNEHAFCDVVVCAKDIPAGTVIGKDDLLVLKINRKTICDSNIISKPSRVINRKAQYKMYKGEWIVPERLHKVSKISLVMDKDKRAFRLWLDQTSGLIGLIEPGSMVDVLAVLPGKSRQQKVAKILLQNIRVLAVANRVARVPTAGENMRDGNHKQKDTQVKAPKATTVTMEVTPKQALELALVMEIGKIHLALRDGTNQKIVDSSSILTLDTLLLKAEDASIEPFDTGKLTQKNAAHMIHGSSADNEAKN
jgi:pilus assembly protein CpaB